MDATCLQTPPKQPAVSKLGGGGGFMTQSPRTPSRVQSPPAGFSSFSPRKNLAHHAKRGLSNSTIFSPTFPKRPGDKVDKVRRPPNKSRYTRRPLRLDENIPPGARYDGQCSPSPPTPSRKHEHDLEGLLGLISSDPEMQLEVYDEENFDPFLFIASLPAPPPCTSFCLPPKEADAPHLTLVLDLDETLVHCSIEPKDIVDPDFTFEVVFNGQTYQVYAKKRPHFDALVHYITGRDSDFPQARFEVVVFTASQRVYAEKLLDILDPGREAFHHRVYRDDCVQVEGNYLKDLTVLRRDLSTTFIVDNSPQAFSYQLHNGVPILTWFEEKSDTELLKLVHFLEGLLRHCHEAGQQGEADVRPYIANKWRLHQRVEQKRQTLHENAMGMLKHSC